MRAWILSVILLLLLAGCVHFDEKNNITSENTNHNASSSLTNSSVSPESGWTLVSIRGRTFYQKKETEHFGGKYNAWLVTICIKDVNSTREYCQLGEIEYYTPDGKRYSGYITERALPALKWIKENTDNSSVFLSWWDYGHMIRGYGERNAVLFDLSQELLPTVADPNITSFDNSSKTVNVARVFVSNDTGLIVQTMKKYNATHIFIAREDVKKARAFFYILNRTQEYSDFFNVAYNVMFTEKGKTLNLYKLLENKKVPDELVLVYSDDFAVIYSLKT